MMFRPWGAVIGWLGMPGSAEVFTPLDRPVYLRVLALQYLLYCKLAGQPPRPVFSQPLMRQVQRFAEE
jgi:uncharacterized membrane protein